jgi:predicted NBD/HSP70 family sugar kinase
LPQIVERNGRLCGCTQRGCLEAYSSASALVQVVQEHLNAGAMHHCSSMDWWRVHCLTRTACGSEGADTTLASYSQADINVKLIFEHATKGDPMCIRLIAEVRHLSLLSIVVADTGVI